MIIVLLLVGCSSKEALPDLSEVWRNELNTHLNAAPAMSAERIYVGDDLGRLSAYERTGGDLLWRYQAEGKIRSEVKEKDGVLVFSSDAQNTYALDASDGTLMWIHEGKKPLTAYDPFVINAISGSVKDGDCLYVGNLDGALYCLDWSTGEELWRFKTRGAIRGTPLLSDDAIYFGNMEGQLYAVDKNSGQERWSFKTKGHVFSPEGQILAGAVSVGRQVVFAARDCNLYALDQESGDLVWSQHFADQPVMARPAPVKGGLVVATYGFHYPKVMMVDSAGQVVWEFINQKSLEENQKHSGGVGSYNNEAVAYTASPVSIDGRIVVGSWDDALYVLDQGSGACQQSFDTGGSIGTAAAVDSLGVCTVTLAGDLIYLEWTGVQ